jgi:hypothetical protein
MLGIFPLAEGLLAFHEELGSMEFELSNEDAPRSMYKIKYFMQTEI